MAATNSNHGPLLALPSGSILQFLFMTLPLLAVYLYFLYLAYDRPNIANPNNPQYSQDRIRLMDILLTYLVTLLPFSTLIVYMLWFVHQRHTLSKRYKSESISILGNVHYNESYYVDDNMIDEAWRDTFKGQVKHTLAKLWAWIANGLTLRNNYGYVVYELEKVANHPACNYEEQQQRHSSRKKSKLLAGTITKKVRVYHRYPREQVSILVLPEYPYSGQPKIDMEADWASFAKYVGLSSSSSSGGELTEEEIDEVVDDPLRRRNNSTTNDNTTTNVAVARVFSRDRSRGVILVAMFWVIFLILASLFVIRQITEVDKYYADEDAYSAWMAFWIIGCGVTPGVACGGNWIRWKMYERWILKSGSKSKGKGGAKKQGTRSSSRGGEADVIDYDDENRGGSYVQMN